MPQKRIKRLLENRRKGGRDPLGYSGLTSKTLKSFLVLYYSSIPVPRNFQMAGSPGLNSAFSVFCLAIIIFLKKQCKWACSPVCSLIASIKPGLYTYAVCLVGPYQPFKFVALDSIFKILEAID